MLKNNPPAAADAPDGGEDGKIGMVPGQDFDMSKLDPAVAKALQAVPKAAQEKIMAHFRDAGAMVNGWMILDEARALRDGVPGSAPRSPPSASAPTGRRTPCTPHPSRTPTASLRRREQVRDALRQGADASGRRPSGP